MLTRVWEMVHGASYPEINQELVFDPLKCVIRARSRIARSPSPTLQRVINPANGLGFGRLPGLIWLNFGPGGGSHYASARDIMKFFQSAWRDRMPGATDNPGHFGGSGATRAADGRSPGSYLDIHYERDAGMIASLTANNYAAKFRWAENIAQLALGKPPLFAHCRPQIFDIKSLRLACGSVIITTLMGPATTASFPDTLRGNRSGPTKAAKYRLPLSRFATGGSSILCISALGANPLLHAGG